MRISEYEVLTFFSAKARLLFRSSLLISPIAADPPDETHNLGILESHWRRIEIERTWNLGKDE